MATLFVSHRVEDFDAFKRVYDSVGDMQRAAGVTEQAVFRSAADPNLVLILHRFATLDQAHAFIESNPDLMPAMAKAGVVESSLTTEYYEDV